MKRLYGFSALICVSVFVCYDTGTGYDIAAWLRARVTPSLVPVVESSKGSFKVEVVIEGLDSPWAIVPVPDGRIFITERPAGYGSSKRTVCSLLLYQAFPG